MIWAKQTAASHPTVASPCKTAIPRMQETVAVFVGRRFVFRWNQRNMGLRIDLILLGDALKSAARSAEIDRTPRKWERPSDHTPVTVDLDI